MLCVLASLVAQRQRKLCIFAQHMESTCVTKGKERQRGHASASGTPVRTLVFLKRRAKGRAQQRILRAPSLRAGRKLEALLSPKMVRGDPLEEKSDRIFKEGHSRKLIV